MMDNENKNKKVCCSVCNKENTDSIETKFVREDEANIVLCEECIEVMYNAVSICKNEGSLNSSDSKSKKEEPLNEKLVSPNPKNVYSFLNEHVVSQEDAKKQLAIGISQHYKRLKDTSIDKSNILIMGPTGTGKTELARTIAKYLDVPFITADATSLTTRGYVGEDVESIISRLVQSCNYNVSKAEKGIIFIDEIDKLAKSQNNDSQIATVSVQQELLKIMEGSIVKVPKGNKNRGDEILVNTKNILFICAGSFDGIQDIVSGPKEKKIGIFQEEEKKNEKFSEKLEVDHLITFGLIPEFLGRLPIIVHTNPLSEEDMLKILVEPQNSITNQYKKMLKLDNIIAEFDIDFLKDLVKQAVSKKLGARGIKKVLEYHLKDLFFNISDFENKEIIIGKEIIEINSSETKANAS